MVDKSASLVPPSGCKSFGSAVRLCPWLSSTSDRPQSHIGFTCPCQGGARVGHVVSGVATSALVECKATLLTVTNKKQL